MRISDWSSDVCSSDPAQPSGNTIAYSQFLDKVEEGTVKEVNVAGEVITGTLKDDSAFRTYAIPDPQLTDRLRKAGVTITARPEESPSIWMTMLYNSLPFLLFLRIAFFVVRQLQENLGFGAVGQWGRGRLGKGWVETDNKWGG